MAASNFIKALVRTDQLGEALTKRKYRDMEGITKTNYVLSFRSGHSISCTTEGCFKSNYLRVLKMKTKCQLTGQVLTKSILVDFGCHFNMQVKIGSL